MMGWVHTTGNLTVVGGGEIGLAFDDSPGSNCFMASSLGHVCSPVIVLLQISRDWQGKLATYVHCRHNNMLHNIWYIFCNVKCLRQ